MYMIGLVGYSTFFAGCAVAGAAGADADAVGADAAGATVGAAAFGAAVGAAVGVAAGCEHPTTANRTDESNTVMSRTAD